MTAVHPRVSTPTHVFVEPVGRRRRAGSVVVSWVTTTDHKKIANLYFISSFVYFLFGGLLALLIRAELVTPGLQIVDNPEQYNQLFTMHGTIMLLLFATPLFAGFANALMPIQIGAPDVAFPRLNMFAYWMYLFGGLIAGRRIPDSRRAPRRSGGSPTPRCPTRPTAPVWVATCGCSGWRWPGSARSWVRSTSSPRSSACAPRA